MFTPHKEDHVFKFDNFGGCLV